MYLANQLKEKCYLIFWENKTNRQIDVSEPDWLKRVIDELQQLEIKIDKLDLWLTHNDDDNIDLELLHLQLHVMTQYMNILQIRIYNFYRGD